MHQIICLNRLSSEDPLERQKQSLEAKGIRLDSACLRKLKVLETDLCKPQLGLAEIEYEYLLTNATHIIHNAWAMSAKRPLKAFASQFTIMQNMIFLARDVSSRRALETKVVFQFISSIAVVGHWPLWTGNKNVPEVRMNIEAVLPNGYGDAKFICELMLDRTLHLFPNRFSPMAVRIGQIAGSDVSGYWNPMEHLSFLWKSSQTLNLLPDFQGLLSWTPVNLVAATLADLLQTPSDPSPIYHIDNPVRQQWSEMIPILADALGVPRQNVVPFPQWVTRVRESSNIVEDNPAYKLIDFLDSNFIRMSCGGLLLETWKSREHSRTLAAVGPVSPEVARRFVQWWKEMRFLKA